MKYKAFLSDSIETLRNEKLICEGNSYQEICSSLSKYFKEHQIHTEPYWRLLMGSTATFIDFGSWSKFVAIVPPIPMSVITGEISEE